jgi:hypothetical protein
MAGQRYVGPPFVDLRTNIVRFKVKKSRTYVGRWYVLSDKNRVMSIHKSWYGAFSYAVAYAKAGIKMEINSRYGK